MSRRGYDIALGGRSIHLAELTIAEMLIANAAGGAGDGGDASFASRLAGLQMAVREVDGVAVTFAALQGKRWDALFPLGQTLVLMGVFDDIHGASKADVEPVASAAVVTETAEGSSTTVTLPSGLAVTLAVLPASRFQAALAVAGKQAAPLARQYMTILDGVRRSIVAIDDQAAVWSGDWIQTWPFSPKETAILGSVWQELHGFTVAESERPTVVVSTR